MWDRDHLIHMWSLHVSAGCNFSVKAGLVQESIILTICDMNLFQLFSLHLLLFHGMLVIVMVVVMVMV